MLLCGVPKPFIHISGFCLDPVSPLSSLKEAEALGIWHWQKLCWTRSQCSGTTFLPNISFCVEHLRTWWGELGKWNPPQRIHLSLTFQAPPPPGKSSADWWILFDFYRTKKDSSSSISPLQMILLLQCLEEFKIEELFIASLFSTVERVTLPSALLTVSCFIWSCVAVP